MKQGSRRESDGFFAQKCLDDIHYYDKVYAMTGAYNLATYTVANCRLFNKRICDEVNMDYPYQMILDGTWTSRLRSRARTTPNRSR